MSASAIIAFVLAHSAEIGQAAAGLYALCCMIVGLLRTPRGGRAAAVLHLLGRVSLLTFRDAPNTLKIPGAPQPVHQPPPIPAELPLVPSAQVQHEPEPEPIDPPTIPQWQLPPARPPMVHRG